jgi:hypothetical protein
MLEVDSRWARGDFAGGLVFHPVAVVMKRSPMDETFGGSNPSLATMQ